MFGDITLPKMYPFFNPSTQKAKLQGGWGGIGANLGLNKNSEPGTFPGLTYNLNLAPMRLDDALHNG